MDRFLLLEDDSSLAEGLMYVLQREGFSVDWAQTLREARQLLRERRYVLLLLDVMLPDGSGFMLCEALRKAGTTTPILFLTAADAETNVIQGLDCGGDDYITKPFRLGELLSRIRALLRRSRLERQTCDTLLSGALTIDLAGSRVYLAGVPLELTGAEYRLLCLLVRHSGQTLTRGQILDALWDGNGNFVDDNTLSVNVRRLREKVELDPSHPEHLLTVRGLGYQWREARL